MTSVAPVSAGEIVGWAAIVPEMVIWVVPAAELAGTPLLQLPAVYQLPFLLPSVQFEPDIVSISFRKIKILIGS
jgi:hypothetical protein